MLALLLSSFLVAAAPPTPPSNLQASLTPTEYITEELGWASKHLSFYLPVDVDVQSLIVKINWWPGVEGEEYNVVKTESAVVVTLCCEWVAGNGDKVDVKYRRERK
jgi:hypothetical protein